MSSSIFYREWSPEGPNPRERDKERDGNVRHPPDLENRRFKETMERRSDHDDHVREHEVEHGSQDQHSDGTEYRKSKSDRIERKRVDIGAVDNRHPRRSHLCNDDDDAVTSPDDIKPRRPARRGDRDENLPERVLRRERESSRQHREYVEYNSEHDGPVLPVRHDKETSRSLRSREMESSINFSDERRYRSSMREMSQDAGHYNPPAEPQDLRLKLGRKREKERQERRQHVYNDAELEEPAEEEAIGKSRIKHHHSYSKSKDEEPSEYNSEDSNRKQRRKHRKHFDDCVEGRSRDPLDKALDEPINSRRLKSKGASNPSSKSSELTRWKPVDSAGKLDKNHNSHSYHTKRKNQRPYRSLLTRGCLIIAREKLVNRILHCWVPL